MAEAQLAPPIGDNKPPLAETAKMEIDDRIAALMPRAEELLASAGRAKLETDDDAGKIADLIKLLKKHDGRFDAARKDVKEPYDDAVKAIDAAPRAVRGRLAAAQDKLRTMLTDHARRQHEAEQQRLAAERQKELEERRREDERRAEAEAAVVAIVEPEPEPEKPKQRRAAVPTSSVAAGDYGAKANRTVKKVPVIVDHYALPLDVLAAPKVNEAILSVVRAMRTGNPDIVIEGIELRDEVGIQVR